jgi:outer membrane immunogenic protein
MKKRLLLASVASIALVAVAGSAPAADLARPVYKAPAYVPPPFTWTGWYIGAFVGGAWPDSDVTVTDLDGYNGIIGHQWTNGLDSSFLGGGTIGYNYQLSPNWVVGLEGEVGYLHVTGTTPDPTSPGLDTVAHARIGDVYGMITGRLGYSWDRWLAYVKGGAAFIGIDASVDDNCNVAPCGPRLLATHGDDTIAAWTVGGGLEWAFAPNWSIKGEYMFIGINDSVTSTGTDDLGNPFTFNHDLPGIHTAKVGINYRFY